MKIEELEKRIENLHRHVQEHPTDCEAIVAEMQYRSKLIDRVRREQAIARVQEIAKIRKRRKDAKQRFRDGDGGRHAEVDSSARSSGDSLSDTIQ